MGVGMLDKKKYCHGEKSGKKSAGLMVFDVDRAKADRHDVGIAYVSNFGTVPLRKPPSSMAS